ncbi:MAG: hypothetical protein ACKVOL_14890, partial [Novosphingobium sp.]
FRSTLPANRSADIGCKEPGDGFIVLSLLKCPITSTFNAEAKHAQMLYRLTINSRFRCLKHRAIAGSAAAPMQQGSCPCPISRVALLSGLG